MKKIYSALALLLMMTVQQVNAVADQPPSKSKCQELFESCKDASNKLTVKMSKESALCKECMEKCSNENKDICAREYKANPKKERANFEGLNVYTRQCKNMCP